MLFLCKALGITLCMPDLKALLPPMLSIGSLRFRRKLSALTTLRFNLADVLSTVAAARTIARRRQGPRVASAMQWRRYTFLNTVRPYMATLHCLGSISWTIRTNGQVSHFLCTAENLAARIHWIHANEPGAKTFIILMVMFCLPRRRRLESTYRYPTNSHVDLFGITLTLAERIFVGLWLTT